MFRTVLPAVAQVFFPRALVNAFIVDADVLTLVDTGTPDGARRIEAALKGLGRRVEDLDRIIVTHRHGDHAGNAARLSARSGARVHVPPTDAPFLLQRREQPKPQPATPLGRILVPYVSVALSWEVEPFPGEPDLIGGATVGPFEVIETPGHTAGHVSLLWKERGVLFTGDAAANITAVGPHPASDEPTLAADSFRRLGGREFSAACFGHGLTVRSGAAERFRSALTH